MNTKECINCGAPANFKKGVKNGKPWAGYFCTDQQCKKVEWVRTGQNGQTPSPAPNTVNGSISNELLFKILEELKKMNQKLEGKNPFPT